MKFASYFFALLLFGCNNEEIETHNNLIALGNEVTKVEIARALRIALNSDRPEDVVHAFIITSAFFLGKSDTPEAKCIGKAISLSGGPAAIIEIASKASVVGSSAWDVAISEGRQFKSLDKLSAETKNGALNSTWLEEYQIEREIILDAIDSMYHDHGSHVFNDWLVCTKD
ncbi:MAG: hypothetical protein Q8K97_08445 [Pseudohongiella sp.]|nr:hypothetical protein [Pseudohongiella sp.]